MPIGDYWNVEYLNANANRRFPLADGVTAEDTSGDFELPNDLIVDLVFPVHATVDMDVNLFHIRQVVVSPDVVVISLGYDGAVIGVTTVMAASHARNTAYPIHGQGDYFDSIGWMTVGDLTTATEYGGSFIFSAAATRLNAQCIRPDIRGVTGIRILKANNSSPGPLLQGDIELVAGTNMQFEVSGVGTGNRIELNATTDDTFEENCNLAGGEDAQPILTINGIGPDANGDFTLDTKAGEECIEISGDSGLHAVLLRDLCSEPCCGCDELEALQTEFQNLASQLNSLDNFINRLDASVSGFQSNVLASGIGNDEICDT